MMSKLTLSRIITCNSPGCNQPGISKDKKCLHHTRYTNCIAYSNNDYPTPETEGVTGDAMGIEIECYPYDCKVEALPHVKFWGTDGSLASYGREIKICNTPQKAQKMAAEIIRAIKLSGGYVNRSCGLHVHTSLPKLNNIVSEYRDTYGRPKIDVVTQFMRAIEQSLWNLFRDRSRTYVSSWIISRSKTIENRAHPATLNPHIMIAWTDFCATVQKTINNTYMGNDTKYRKWIASGDIMYGVHKNSYTYRYLKARKNNNGRMQDNEFSLA